MTREHIKVYCSRSDKKFILSQSNLNKVKKKDSCMINKNNILYLPKKVVYYLVNKTSDKR